MATDRSSRESAHLPFRRVWQSARAPPNGVTRPTPVSAVTGKRGRGGRGPSLGVRMIGWVDATGPADCCPCRATSRCSAPWRRYPPSAGRSATGSGDGRVLTGNCHPMARPSLSKDQMRLSTAATANPLLKRLLARITGDYRGQPETPRGRVRRRPRGAGRSGMLARSPELTPGGRGGAAVRGPARGSVARRGTRRRPTELAGGLLSC